MHLPIVTFEDWCKCDRVDQTTLRPLNLPNNDPTNKDYLGAGDLGFGGFTIYTELVEDDILIKIRSFQKDCYNKLLNLYFEGFKHYFLSQHDSSIQKELLLKDEIERTRIFLNEDKNALGNINRGVRRYGAIIGSLYRLVERYMVDYNKGDVFIPQINDPFPDLDYIIHHAYWLYSNWLLNLHGSNEKKTLAYSSLFIDQKYAEVVKVFLERNGYTINGKWADRAKSNSIATAFYVLKDVENGLCLIKSGKNTPQLISWCKEFGVIAAEKGGDVTIRNLTKRPQYDIEGRNDYKDFTSLFTPLLKMK